MLLAYLTCSWSPFRLLFSVMDCGPPSNEVVPHEGAGALKISSWMSCLKQHFCLQCGPHRKSAEAVQQPGVQWELLWPSWWPGRTCPADRSGVLQCCWFSLILLSRTLYKVFLWWGFFWFVFFFVFLKILGIYQDTASHKGNYHVRRQISIFTWIKCTFSWPIFSLDSFDALRDALFLS